MQARGKRRGFSPAAAARHSKSARIKLGSCLFMIRFFPQHPGSAHNVLVWKKKTKNPIWTLKGPGEGTKQPRIVQSLGTKNRCCAAK